jgi:methyltransferase
VVPAIFVSVVLIGILGAMIVELRVSQANERVLREQGAVDPPDEVYATMRWAYPGAFVAMAVEGIVRGAPFRRATLAGIVLLLASKALKTWAIVSLGRRWTYRVWVIPGAPLVNRGPYAFVRHPNYLAVIGELIGMAMTVGAIVSGPVAVVCFGWLLQRRIAAEERALGMRDHGHRTPL